MPGGNRGFALVVSLLCLMIVSDVLADQILVKIDSDDVERLPGFMEDYNVRFRGKSLLLLQVDEDQFAEISSFCIALDSIRPQDLYYLVWIGREGSNLSKLEKLGHVLLKFDDSVLLRIDPSDELLLISLNLPLAPLPEGVKLYPQWKSQAAPMLKAPAEIASAAAMVGDIVGAVSADDLHNIVYDLQENRDLDPPHTAYRSRYCLRVAETDDPSDDACDNASEYIYNKFKSYGLDVEYDSFPHKVLTQGQYQMRNVVATLPGKGLKSHRTYLITAHYDSIALNSINWLLEWKTMAAPGADDNASGAAGVLEAARVLSEYDFNCTIKFVTFSGEELGLHGSKHYTSMAAENGEDIAGVINLDMIAYDPDELDIDLITNMNSEWLVEAMRAVQKEYNVGPLILKKIVNPGMVYSDHASFWHKGWNAILGIDNSDFDSPEFYPDMHTTEDTIEKLDFTMTARMTQVVAGTIAKLAEPIGGEPHPDLSVTSKDISISPERPDRGQTVQMTANVHNLGNLDAESVRVQILLIQPFAEDPELVDEEIIDVKVGESAQISAPLELTEWGDYQVVIKANPDYDIFETNGGNNIATKIIRISSESSEVWELIIYPNPLYSTGDGKVNLAYSLSKDTPTRLEIYSASGKLVYQEFFVSGEDPGGKYGANKIEWDGENIYGEKVASGVYFCYVIADDASKGISGKLLIIR